MRCYDITAEERTVLERVREHIKTHGLNQNGAYYAADNPECMCLAAAIMKYSGEDYFDSQVYAGLSRWETVLGVPSIPRFSDNNPLDVVLARLAMVLGELDNPN